MYQPTLDPLAGSLGWSALIAALPVLTLFVLLGVFRTRAWVAAVAGLSAALIVAVVGYAMPVDQALLAASQGAAFGLFPLAWTFTTAIWIFLMTVESGHFAVVQRALGTMSGDRCIQALVIAFCFGSVLEGLAGQGVPVAITTVMLLSIGFKPMLAATTALVANTVPAAFGPVGLPITTLAKVTGLPASDLGAMVGRQVPIVAVVVPLVVILVADGYRALRRHWRLGLSCGVVYGLTQFAVANFAAVALADIIAGLSAGAVVVGVTRVRSVALPASSVRSKTSVGAGQATAGVRQVSVPGESSAGSTTATDPDSTGPVDSPRDLWLAASPYLALIATLGLSQWPFVADLLARATTTFTWPGLHLLTSSGEPSTLSRYTGNWLSAPGSLVLAAGLVTVIVLRIRPREAAQAYGRAILQLRGTILCVMALLAMSLLINASGQAATLGHWMAQAGAFFLLLSPVLGWLGVALTGSDTSSNSLFGALQVTAARQAELDPTLLAAANASGGVMGKMVSLQNLSIAAGAVGMGGQEGQLLRRTLGWSLLLLGGMCIVVALQGSPVGSWMVP
ncbi:MAG: L-lactate permease [Phycicoccus sp.]